METNDLKDIFGGGGTHSGNDSENWTRNWEELQADIPELSDIDLNASDFPNPSELSDMRGDGGSGAGSWMKSLGLLGIFLMASSLLVIYLVGQYQEQQLDKPIKKIELAKHQDSIDPRSEQRLGAVVDNESIESEVDSDYYVNHIMETPEIYRDDLDVKQLDMKQIQPLFFQVEKENHRVNRYARDYNYKYVRNYKVYNYENRLRSQATAYNTLDARYSNWADYKHYYRPEMDFMEYEELLVKAMKYMDKSRYREVDLIMFSIIKSYPEDQNAWFYAGISSYRQKNFTEAIECFDYVLELKSLVFLPESEWYRSLCLLQIGEREKALEELNVIANSGGFYESPAKELLAKQK